VEYLNKKRKMKIYEVDNNEFVMVGECHANYFEDNYKFKKRFNVRQITMTSLKNPKVPYQSFTKQQTLDYLEKVILRNEQINKNIVESWNNIKNEK